MSERAPPERGMVKIADEVEDTFFIFVQQKTGDFVICHNNNFDCYCSFCSSIGGAIASLDRKLKLGR